MMRSWDDNDYDPYQHEGNPIIGIGLAMLLSLPFWIILVVLLIRWL